MPKLCSFGCAPSDVPMHRFPSAEKFPERFKAWVNLVGGKLETAVDYEYYKTKLVCDIHFTAKDCNRYNRLNALTVPSLHLHGPSARKPDISLVTQPFDVQATNTGTLAREPDISLISQPSDLHATNTGTTGREPDISLVSQPSDLQTTNTATIHATAAASAVIMDHNYSKASRSSIKTFRMGSAPSSISYSYVQLKAMSTKVKQLRSEISRLRNRGLTFKSRLANAAKLSQNAAFQQVIKNLKTPAQLFVHTKCLTAAPKRFTSALMPDICCLTLVF